MKKINFISFVFGIILFISCNSTKNEAPILDKEYAEIERVEPPNWWIGFENKQLQLLVKHPNIGSYSASINYPGVTVTRQHKAKSPNYLFLDLEISDSAPAGKFNIRFTQEGKSDLNHTYELKAREEKAAEYVGFNSSDVIYLITPDRFANANPNNDSVKELKETEVDRKDNYKRHGGDIEGIINGLDYISDMGFTAVWPCPLLTNDMPRSSYHGYAITDYYQIDPRFGTFDDYKILSDEASKRGMKLVMDQVANHCGLEHWWMKDLPFEDWVNDQENFEKNRENWNWETTKTSNHRRTTNQDLYASEIDKKGMSEGWFVSAMPDLNQRNPFMATYLIQNSIWWVEAANLGGIRQDTYPYPDKEFMAKWAGAIMKEYPNFSIVGEEWSYNPLLIGYWQDGHKNKDGYESNLKSSMDFAMQQNIVDALNQPESWDKGLVKIYEGLANDFAYTNPKDLLVFPDNHDMSRIFTQLKGNVANTKMALGYLLALPRTAQVYYGTEILMNDFEKPGDHGLIRTDFPGGWDGDTVNAFTGEGLTADQKDMQSYLKKVLNYRKSSKAIHQGKTVHFAPRDGIYAMFRIHEDEIIAVILNKSDETSIEIQIVKEIGLDGKKMKNIVSGESFIWGKKLTINPNGITLLTTKL